MDPYTMTRITLEVNGLPRVTQAVRPIVRGLRGAFRRAMIALLSAILLPASTAAEAPSHSGVKVFEENFDALPDGALPKTWRVDGGEWRVTGGKLRAKATKYLSRLFFPIGKDLRDVGVEVDAAFLNAKNSTRWLALMVRSPRGRPAPFLIFTSRFDRSKNSGLEIGFNIPDEKGKRSWRIFRHGRCDIPAETSRFHRLRFEVRGRLATGFIDGKPVIDALLPKEAVMSGEVGLIVSDVTAEFDNLRVEELKPSTLADIERFVAARCPLPLIIGHRGNSRYAPENTLVSFRQAFNAGADGVEMDLRCSRDGVLYLLHDKTLDRTTDGKGDASKRTMAELKQLDAGSWKSAKYAGTRIPTFEEAARLCAGRGLMLLDLKEEGLGAKIAEVVRRTGTLDQIVVCCWSDAQLADVHRHLPDAVIVKLGDAPFTWKPGWFRELRSKGAAGFSCSLSSVTPAFLRQAIAAAMPVYVWTVNEPYEIVLAFSGGVQGILTDDPALARRVITEHRLRMWTWQDP